MKQYKVEEDIPMHLLESYLNDQMKYGSWELVQIIKYKENGNEMITRVKFKAIFAKEKN